VDDLSWTEAERQCYVSLVVVQLCRVVVLGPDFQNFLRFF